MVMDKKSKKQQAGDGDRSRFAMVDLDDPSVAQMARMLSAVGWRLQLRAVPLAPEPEPEPEPEPGPAEEPDDLDDLDGHLPAVKPTANPLAWAVYCLGCSSDAHPGVFPCRRDYERYNLWDRIPPQLVADP